MEVIERLLGVKEKAGAGVGAAFEELLPKGFFQREITYLMGVDPSVRAVSGDSVLAAIKEFSPEGAREAFVRYIVLGPNGSGWYREMYGDKPITGLPRGVRLELIESCGDEEIIRYLEAEEEETKRIAGEKEARMGQIQADRRSAVELLRV